MTLCVGAKRHHARSAAGDPRPHTGGRARRVRGPRRDRCAARATTAHLRPHSRGRGRYRTRRHRVRQREQRHPALRADQLGGRDRLPSLSRQLAHSAHGCGVARSPKWRRPGRWC
jgi:hypothetical protein